MEELVEIKAMIETFRETLTFLVEQEKIRGEEVAALNEKIEAVNKTLFDDVINPSLEAYNESQFNDFKEKYGDKLNQYDDTIRTSMNDPEYDSARETWNQMQSLSDEEKQNFDTDAFVEDVSKGLSDYVDKIKESLGLSEDAPVEIKEDENGDVEVKADVDGDGKMEEVATETETTEPAEPSDDAMTEDEEDEVDPELQKELDEWAKNN